MHRKALSGRGCKRSERKSVMFTAIEDEFRRLRALGVKLTRKLVCEMAMHLVDDLLDTHRIVTRRRTGNKSFSVEAELEMEQAMAYLLGTLKRNYDDGLDNRCVENHDECHFLFDLDDGRCLDFVGTSTLTFAQIASAGKGFTVCLRVSGGVAARLKFR